MLIDPTLHLLEYLEALPPTNSEPWPDDHPKVPSRIPFRQRNPLTSLSFNLWKCRYWPDWWTLHFLVCICVRLQGFTKVSNIQIYCLWHVDLSLLLTAEANESHFHTTWMPNENTKPSATFRNHWQWSFGCGIRILWPITIAIINVMLC